MKQINFFAPIFFFFLLLGFGDLYSILPPSKIEIRALTKDEEFVRIKETVAQLSWLKTKGVRIFLPHHAAFEELYTHGQHASQTFCTYRIPENPQFPNEHYFKKVFISEIYSPSSYEHGLQKLEEQKQTIEKACERLSLLHEH